MFGCLRTTELNPNAMIIKVLGGGCAKCKALENVTKEAIAGLGIEATIEKVDDMAQIMRYGVMRTPALVVDEKLVLAGRVPQLAEVMQLIANPN